MVPADNPVRQFFQEPFSLFSAVSVVPYEPVKDQ